MVDIQDESPLKVTYLLLTLILYSVPAGLNFTEYGRDSNDYSTWTFTYTNKYHLINEGVNELTAKLSCDIGPFNVTKYDSVNVTGIPTED